MQRTRSHPAQPSPRRKRLFLAFTVSVPVLFFVALELTLRVSGYGPDLSLFKPHEIRRQTYELVNPGVKERYFGGTRFSPSTALDFFPVPKPQGVYRIFCLGGSTTVGYPYLPNGSFAAFLRDRLRAVFPRRRVEIINLGMTATNSFTVLDIARELPQYQPDLLIVYDGHNEFYGALGAASRQSAGSSRLVTQLYLRLIHYRTFQLLRDTFQRVRLLLGKAPEAVSRGTMMETLARDQVVPAGGRIYDAAYAMFRGNLEDLRECCRSAGIPVILGTQVSNLRDQPPFVSGGSPDVPQERQALFQRLYRSGVDLQARGAADSAIAVLRSASALDTLHADAHYRLARSLDAAGSRGEALREYVRARDCDELRFRTDTRFNNLIRSMAEGRGCLVADCEAAFKSLSEDSLIGRNLIMEHLHPNAKGNFVIARVYARVMREAGLLAPEQDWRSTDTVDEAALWENRCVTVLDDRIAEQNTAVLTSGWPFKAQEPALEVLPSADTLGRIAQKVAANELDWRKAHEQAIAFYQRRGDLASVEREYRTILSQFPLDLELYLDLARVCLRERRFNAMRSVLERSLEVYPTLQAYRTLGDVMMQQGDAAAALGFYEKMDGFMQSPAERLQNHMAVSVAFARAGQPGKARARLLDLLKEKPNYGPALQLLAEINRQMAQQTPPPQK